MPGSRTAILIRIYLTLVGVSLLLIATNVYRHFPAFLAPGDPIGPSFRAQPREAAATPVAGPTINWGGQRR